MKSLKLKQGKYLIAVSGGPDSMALLNMAREEGLEIEVAHVNYHKRDTAKRDEKIVRSYCEQYGIPVHVKDVYPGDVKGNFQAYAREVRYAYFANLCRRYGLDGTVTAHQQDDLLETYLMQKEKKLGVEYYGLKEETRIKGVSVIRPLLDCTKEELLSYCEKKGLDYGIDESNLTDVYTRN
ncbi:MAG: tRNA lysidine(34) synthetase TilS, partial [Erysipelotrichaceae bacterium]|nr:tRNA lysidine(34) synthetase TilS [Erysipelotrichaceae bacterium]